MSHTCILNEALLTEYRPAEHCMQQMLPTTFGSGHSKTFELDRGLSLIETRYRPTTDIAVLSTQELREPRMVITLALKGHSRFIDHNGSELSFKQGCATITTFGSIAGERHYRADCGATEQIRLVLSKSQLQHIFGADSTARFFSRSTMRLLSCRPISAQGMLAAQQLTACNVADAVKPLYREGLARTLLAAELHPLFTQAQRDTGKLSPRDKPKAMLARDILYAEFRSPPSIAALARRVGTNQCKLKQLFHHFFANTPYGLLLTIRMNHAYQLLESGQYHVGVVADLVGYRHASNFSAAFTQYFGIPPKQISKLR